MVQGFGLPAKKGANLINQSERCEASRSDPGDSEGLKVGLHVRLQKLQKQDERAELLKDRLRWEQRELRTRLEKLQGGSERMRNDSLGSAVSSERSDSERGDHQTAKMIIFLTSVRVSVSLV